MKIAAGVGAVLLGLPVVLLGGGYVAAGMKLNSVLATQVPTHDVDFPIPFPLTEAEVAQLRAEKLAAMPPSTVDAAAPVDPNAPVAAPVDPLAGVDLNAIAAERAIARGKHLVEARYACMECHGEDFAGGKMVDDPMVGRWYGANITLGKGSHTLEYTAKDWDHIVRHGIRPDHTPVIMPSKDFFGMSDQELSDIVMYVRSLPPVDKESEPLTYGPILKVLVATDQAKFSAFEHPDHMAPHAQLPPPEAPDAAFGEHLLKACSGCHRADLSGGPIVGGPPEWPPAGNLTKLHGWSYDQFRGALLEGKRPDGTPLRPPMSDMPKVAKHMTETELQAMYAHLHALPEKPDNK